MRYATKVSPTCTSDFTLLYITQYGADRRIVVIPTATFLSFRS
jgi:hypothetical protein